MKHNTEKRTNVLKDRNSDWELRQIQLLNADQNRLYPEYERSPKSYRVQIVFDAIPSMGSRFAFIRQTSHIARAIHNRNGSRFAHSVNRAMQMISSAAVAPKKPAVSVGAGVAA